MSWPIAGRSALGTSRIPRMISVSSPDRPSTRTRTASICASRASSPSSAIARRLISSSCSLIVIFPGHPAQSLQCCTRQKQKTTWANGPHGLLVRGAFERRGSLCCFQAERALRGAHQLGKQSVALLRELRQHLAIDLDPCLLEPVHQAAVRDAAFAGERVDARNPQRAVIALFLLAIAIGVGEALLERRSGLPVEFAPTDKTGGELQLPLMTAAGLGSAFGARHRSRILPCYICALV